MLKVVGLLAATVLAVVALLSLYSPDLGAHVSRQLASAAGSDRFPDDAYPEGYKESEPKYSSMLDVVLAWNPDDPTIPEEKLPADTLEVLDWNVPEDRKRAETLRDLEIPYKLVNLDNLNEVVKKWKDDAYVLKGMSSRGKYQVGKSHNAHFMFYHQNAMHKELHKNLRPKEGYRDSEEASTAFRSKGYTFDHPPPVPVKMSFQEFWDESRRLQEENKRKPLAEEAESPHIYLTTGDNWQGSGDTIVGKDIQLFAAEETRPFFIVNPTDVRGQHCRFGMRGVTAEMHWDGHRNWIAMLRGVKRYILNPPRACIYMRMMHQGPSRRHTSVDFSSPDHVSDEELAAQLDKAETVETLLREGEVLYVPSGWLHHIQSLDGSIQCNTRSGISPLYNEDALNMGKCEAGIPPSPATDEEKAAAKAKLDKHLDKFRLSTE